MFEIDKEEAINICRNLCYEFGRSNPDVVEIIYSSKELMLLSDLPKKSSFTRGEKQLLRTIGMMLQADYSMTDLKHQDVDYGAMRVHVELLERALIDGLEDRNISIIEIDVLFNDVLKDDILKIVIQVVIYFFLIFGVYINRIRKKKDML